MISSFRTRTVSRLAALAAAMVAGCASHVEPPKLPVEAPAAWLGNGGSEPVRADWWTAFGDPVLSALVAEALEKNTDIRLASARVGEARALVAVQKGAELPTFEIAAGATRADAISPVSRRPFYSGSTQDQFQSSYEIDLWGRLMSLSEASDARLNASLATRDAMALSVASLTAATYINLRALDERLDLARQTLASREAAVSFARARQVHGYASKLELSQAESEYHATALVVPQLELSIDRTEHALCVLLGRPPGVVARGAALSALKLPPLPAAGLPSELTRRRPDIASSEALVVASDAQLAASRAQLLPSVRLTAAFGEVTSTIYTKDPFKVWSFGGSILAPIFEGGRLRAQVQVSRSQRDEALLSYEKSVLVAFSEVEDQLSSVKDIESQEVELDAQHTATAEALRIARNRFQSGYSTYLEVLDAQRTLFGVEQQTVQARADILVANVNLYRALGGGWK